MNTLTQAFPIVAPAPADQHAPRHRQRHARQVRPEHSAVDLRQYLADDTARGRPPGMIGVHTVMAMQWIMLGAVVLRVLLGD